MGKILLFSTTGCVFCDHAKTTLNKYNIPFHEINLLNYPSLWTKMVEITNGQKSVPQIFFQNNFIGGCEELLELEKSGELVLEAQKALLADENSSWNFIPIQLRSPATPNRDDEFECPPPLISEEIENIFYRLKDKLDGLQLKTRLIGFRPTTLTFLGNELVDWLKQKMEIPENSAKKISQQMLDFKFFINLEKKSKSTQTFNFEESGIYKFFDDIAETMNSMTEWTGDVRSSVDVVLQMRQILYLIERYYFIANGKEVNYPLISKSPLFRAYNQIATELQKINLRELADDPNQLMSFFINTYNMLMIHGIIKYGHPSSAISRKSFFNNVSYLIGGLKFSLNDIEHGILRGNRKPPGSLFRPFSKSDERLEFSVRIFDPRIHFVLVCGAKSCPPIKIYSAENIDMALQLAAESFCASEVRISDDNNTVRLSQIFEWYANDFGKDINGVLSFVCGFVEKSDQKKLLSMLDNSDKTNTKINVTYNEYDWGPNFFEETFEDFVEETFL